jgi:hypothetical protein
MRSSLTRARAAGIYSPALTGGALLLSGNPSVAAALVDWTLPAHGPRDIEGPALTRQGPSWTRMNLNPPRSLGRRCQCFGRVSQCGVDAIAAFSAIARGQPYSQTLPEGVIPGVDRPELALCVRIAGSGRLGEKA